MVRKLIKSLLSLSLIAPLSAFALGLGDVRLNSALGERLQADIELLSVTPAEAESLSVSLASQQTFDKVGLERPSVLMFLRFEVVEQGGTYTVKATSREPINEPFLDFLLEVEWASGRVLREYTLLLDPPTGHKDSAPTVSTPAAASSTVAAPVTTSSSSAPSRSAMQPATSGSMASMPMRSTPVMPADGSIVYGPVKANDTLWRIAEKLRPSDVSVQQMMVALVKANPYAFFDNNINRLKRGFVLRIDDPTMLSALSKAEAAREVARQTRAWHDYREKVAGRAKQRPAAASAVEATPGAAAAGKSEPKLTLVSPEGKGMDSATPSGTKSGAGDEASEELMLALESSAAQRKQNEALKSRLEALEGQLQDMEQIISLKDADLAALQQQLRKQGAAVELTSEQKPADEVVKAESGVAAPEMTADAKPELVVKPGEEKAAADAVKLAQSEMGKPVEAPADAVMAKSETETPVEAAKPAEMKPAETAAKKPVAKPKPKKKPVVQAPVQEPSFFESLMQDPMMMGVGGGTILLVLILLFMIIKRRRKSGFQESILNGGTSSMMKANDEQGSETSFLSDLAISGMGPGTIQTDEGEVDPLTEADVFMAYGRNQQAEEVLKKARDASPERTDVTAKLLEVYYNGKDKEKFEALAEEAVGSLQDNDEVWGKVLAMGHELCPDNVLFEAGAGAELPAAETSSEGAADTVMDIGLDLDELSAEMEGEGGGDMDLDLGLDFSDLDDDASSSPASDSTELFAEESSDVDELGPIEFEMPDEPASEESASTDDASLDFDLDLAGTGEETAAEDDNSIDFDLDLGAIDSDAADEGDSGMEFDLGELSTDEAEAATGADDDMGLDLDLGELSTEEPVETDTGLDMGEIDLADLESADTTGDSLDLDMDLGEFDDLDDLGDLEGAADEMTTKLDLAQAYAEMGDAEGARSMLEEVVSAGNDEQKQQAQALLDKL